MAKKGFDLDFEGFLDFAKTVDELGEGYLKLAVENAFQKSKEYVSTEIVLAMNKSKYAFAKGERNAKNRPATGKALASVKEVARLPVEWDGNTARAYMGVDLDVAPEGLILALGTPTVRKDTTLYNAIKVKGKVRKAVDSIQQREFQKVINEAMKNG